MEAKETKVCARCVMSNIADNSIKFDENGFCNYCTAAISQIGKVYCPNEEGAKKLEELLKEIKKNGKNKKYDCLMGMSGGLDSSYLAYLGYKWGLRVLAVHIDDGFDTEISKNNLRKLVLKTGYDYEVINPDASQFNDLTKAYMKAGVPNLAVPQDNVLFAFIYMKMKQHGIKYFLTGGNFALESILQRGNTHNAFDVVNIKDIHNKFGTKPMNKLKLISTTQMRFDSRILKIETPRPLNFIDYDRNRAFRELNRFCDFQYYGRKHLENILTAFIQLYWFPVKFGVDKRTSHLSSMIVSGQISREQAFHELSEPIYNEEQMKNYIKVVKEKLEISDKEFEEIISAPTHQHNDYRTEDKEVIFRLLRRIFRMQKG